MCEALLPYPPCYFVMDGIKRRARLSFHWLPLNNSSHMTHCYHSQGVYFSYASLEEDYAAPTGGPAGGMGTAGKRSAGQDPTEIGTLRDKVRVWDGKA